MATEARDVLEILAMFDHAKIEVWIEGGWGVDALLGAQSRDHGDLDLVVDAPRSDDARRVLEGNAFVCIYDDAPGRFSYQDARGREVDLSVAAADRYGDRWNLNRRIGRGDPDYPFECFVSGWIGGQRVQCLGPETQVLHHQGYEPEDVDRWDMGLLRERFDVALPELLR
jgi:lincosamide nucleotidyltransferase A/C/D/E